MPISDNFGLYAILTDPLKGYEFMARLFTDYKIAYIQLRMKKEPPDVILKTAEKLRKIINGTDSRLIINDDPAIAAAVGADGVHIGQEDMPYDQVRKIVGPGAIIGISTRTPAEATAACALKPDYIGIGPLFPTPTKVTTDPAIGIEGMKEMLSLTTLPSVAIGGIELSNLREVLGAGARNFCMVRQLTQVEEPERVLRDVLRIHRECRPAA
jgi:thiamine-phosphate pyrophosphorylase